MQPTEITTSAVSGTEEVQSVLPAALRPRAEEEQLTQRANRLVSQLGEHARSPLIEPRFLEGARGLALAFAGLAAMRANDFAGALAEELGRRLERVLAEAEAQVAAILPALVDAHAARRRPVRRATRAPASEPSPGP